MNIFDDNILSFFNQFALASEFFDRVIFMIANNKLFKGGIMVSLIWALWFKKGTQQYHVRKHLLITLLISIVAIIMGKTLALNLPFRYRPIHNPDLDFNLPHGMLATAESHNGVLLSSMPSDHAVLYFALATGLWFVSRKIGLLMLCYTFIMIAMPRIYLGLHYPTDIIVGALTGVVVAIAANKLLSKNKLVESMLKFSDRKPEIFYAIFFLFSYQIADLFTDSYAFVKSNIKFLISL